MVYRPVEKKAMKFVGTSSVTIVRDQRIASKISSLGNWLHREKKGAWMLWNSVKVGKISNVLRNVPGMDPH